MVPTRRDVVERALERGGVDGWVDEALDQSATTKEGEDEAGVPTELLPAAMRASLISVIIDAVVGAEADVPKTSSKPAAEA